MRFLSSTTRQQSRVALRVCTMMHHRMASSSRDGIARSRGKEKKSYDSASAAARAAAARPSAVSGYSRCARVHTNIRVNAQNIKPFMMARKLLRSVRPTVASSCGRHSLQDSQPNNKHRPKQAKESLACLDTRAPHAPRP